MQNRGRYLSKKWVYECRRWYSILPDSCPAPWLLKCSTAWDCRVLRITAPTEDLLLQFAPDVYDQLQAGKETRMLDLKTTEGRELLLKMVQKAAVLIESNLPGTMERLGVGPEVLRAVQPKIVYVRMAGYRDPSSNQCPGHDLTYLAAAGLIRKLQSAWESMQIADLCGAFWTAMAALDGLRRGGGFYEVLSAEAAQALALPAVPLLGRQCVLLSNLSRFGWSSGIGGPGVASMDPLLHCRWPRRLDWHRSAPG